MTISLSLEAIISALYRRRHRGEYAFLEWASTETLQLQRMAFQGVKSGSWSGYTRAVPMPLSSGETMVNLPVKYPLRQDSSEHVSNDTRKTAPAVSVNTSTQKTPEPREPEESLKGTCQTATKPTATVLSPRGVSVELIPPTAQTPISCSSSSAKAQTGTTKEGCSHAAGDAILVLPKSPNPPLATEATLSET